MFEEPQFPTNEISYFWSITQQTDKTNIITYQEYKLIQLDWLLL